MLQKMLKKDIGKALDPEYLMVIREVGYDPSLPRQPYSHSATTSSPATTTRTGISLHTTYDGRVRSTYINTGTSVTGGTCGTSGTSCTSGTGGTGGTKNSSSTTRSKSRI
jgi:hypothetical protein